MVSLFPCSVTTDDFSSKLAQSSEAEISVCVWDCKLVEGEKKKNDAKSEKVAHLMTEPPKCQLGQDFPFSAPCHHRLGHFLRRDVATRHDMT